MIIRIPRSFFDDHLSRDLPTPREYRRTKRHVWIDTDDPALAELIEDAQFYTDPWGPGRALPENIGLYRAALGLLRAIEQATKASEDV